MVEQVDLSRKRSREFCQMSRNEKEILNVLLDETHLRISMKVEMREAHDKRDSK